MLALLQNNTISEKKNYIIFSLILTFGIIILYFGLINKLNYLLLFSALPLLLILSLSNGFNNYFLVSLLFIPIYFGYLNIAVWGSFLLFFKVMLLKRITVRDIQENKVMLYLFIYLMACIPSLYNSIDISRSLILGFNLISFAIIAFCLPFELTSINKAYQLIKVFIIFNIINAVFVVIQGVITHERVFGIAGIMFVDYVGIAILLYAVLYVLKNKKISLKATAIITLLVAASVMTQTRNAWLTTVLTLIVLLVFLLIKSNYFGLPKKLIIISSIVIFFVLFVSFIFVKNYSSELEKRTVEITKLENSFDNEGKIQNSFLTRLLIWHTAYNGFIKHPIAGIGLYSFPFSSSIYYTIPPYLYQLYVEGLSPHQGFIAVLAETGLIGFAGFIMFLYLLIRLCIRSFAENLSDDEKYLLLAIFSALLYITISLMVTDAWLWGSGIVLWGIFAGLLMGTNLFIKRKYAVTKIK